VLISSHAERQKEGDVGLPTCPELCVTRTLTYRADLILSPKELELGKDNLDLARVIMALEDTWTAPCGSAEYPCEDWVRTSSEIGVKSLVD
jgi:hypothetical protein